MEHEEVDDTPTSMAASHHSSEALEPDVYDGIPSITSLPLSSNLAFPHNTSSQVTTTMATSSSSSSSNHVESINNVLSSFTSPPVVDPPRDIFKDIFSVDNRTRTPMFPFPKTRRLAREEEEEEPTRLRGLLPPQYHVATTLAEADITTTATIANNSQSIPSPQPQLQPSPPQQQQQQQPSPQRYSSPYSPPLRLSNVSNVSNHSPFDDNLSTQSHLFGECISVASSHPRTTFVSYKSSPRSSTTTTENHRAERQAENKDEESSSLSQWHDIELGETSPLRTKNQARAGHRSSAAAKLQLFLASNPRIAALLHQANGRILDVAHTASRELEHLLNSAMSRLAQWFPISVLQSDLSFLQQVHRLKMEQLKTQDQLADDDYYDFGLILSSQQVYAFWADLLDFRAEYLGDASVENLNWVENDEDEDYPDDNVSPTNSEQQPSSSSTPTSGTQCSSGSEENHNPKESEDVVQPLMTSPMTGIRRRKGTDSNTPRVRLASYDSAMDKQNSANQSKLMYSPAVLSATGSYAFRPISKRQSLFERAVGPFSPPRTSSKSRLMDYDDDDIADELDESNQDMTPTPLRSTRMMTPSLSSSAQRRRRWGNYALNGAATSTMNLMSPPVYELQRAQSMRPRRPTLSTPPSSSQTITSPPNSAMSIGNNNNDNTDSQKQLNESERRRQQRRSLRIEDIPTQVIPRGIAARTNGMLPFLSALKRGIVVRKHRANVEAVFCKLLSKDGGDTIE